MASGQLTAGVRGGGSLRVCVRAQRPSIVGARNEIAELAHAQPLLITRLLWCSPPGGGFCVFLKWLAGMFVGVEGD